MDENTHLVITVVSSKNTQFIITGVITVAFVIGVGAGMLIQYFLSKLDMGKLFKIFIYVLSIAASVIAILQAFGKWGYLMDCFNKIIS